MSRNARIALATGNAIAFLATIIVNYLSNALPINGQTPGDISDKYYTLFTPAGLTFAIWGIIYLLLAIYIIYQIIDAFRLQTDDASFVDKISIWFIVSCVANSSWIFAWHYEILWLSVLIMLLLLTSLIVIYLHLNIGQSSSSTLTKSLVHVPFSIYLAWISVATIANISAFLSSLGWQGGGLGAATWAIIVILVAIGLGVLISQRKGDIFYAAVIAWACFGIYTARTNDEVIVQSIQWTAIVGIVLLLLSACLLLFKKRTYLS
ncbi:MAG: hypothetical protein AAF849_20695 [Bacteroidota bacterium]